MSIIEPRDLTLADGETLRLRSPVEDDAPDLLAYLDAVRRESDGILFAPEDALPDEAWERKWIAGNREGEGVQVMAHTAEGDLVALCGIGRSDRVRIRHRGDIGISARAAWCNRGLGTALMEVLIAWARRQPGLDVLCLSVYAHNDRARRVYENVGFTVEGRRRWQVWRNADEGYADDQLMSLWVGEPPRIEPVILDAGAGVRLRLVEPADADAVYRMIVSNRSTVTPWLDWVPTVKHVREVRSAIDRWRQSHSKDGSCTMLIEADGNPAGLIYHLRMDRRVGSVEIGYWLDADHRGRGVMTRALRALTDYSIQTLELDRVWLKAGAENLASRRVAQRAGFELEGVSRKAFRLTNGQLIDVAIYSEVSPNEPIERGG